MAWSRGEAGAVVEQLTQAGPVPGPEGADPEKEMPSK